ncbi:hypothetical protein Ddye_019502 [Dipteronia dyeriana]|uniref:Receptor-like serine/threonine-protein kinase n=1 Tax=Dipteronia dyeriana TaxID=168575 RepID=A0AAD9TYG3_9ROSI|nr:hypothetical protein Ddye_019502 [Dipteronia dyeriana]
MNPVKWLLYTVVLIVCLLVQFSTSTDTTITENHSIKDGELIVSSGKVFALGFFSPGKSLKRYVGIWFRQIQEQTVVWVANRDDPINGTSGVLSINDHGNLILYETNRTASTVPVWSTNVSVTSLNGTVAELLDSGNLVLVENGTKNILWQSFDHPTDTILPLMKYGLLDRRTGVDRFITSWKSSDDPGSGDYSQKIDPTGFPQLSLYKGSSKWWRLGSWTGKRWNGVPEMTVDPVSNYNFVNNRDEVSIVFSVNDSSVITRMIVNGSGHVQRFTWKNREKIWTWTAPNSLPCDYYGHCGPNSNCDPNQSDEFECTCLPGFEPKYLREWNLRNWSGGCARKHGMSTCQRGERFEKMARMKVPDTSVTRVNMSLDLKECENKCLSDCTCIAYTSAYSETNGGIGCLTYHGEMMDTRGYTNAGQDLYLRVADESDGLLGKKAIVAIVIASFIAMLLMIAATTLLFRRRRREKAMKNQISLSFTESSYSFSRKQQDLSLLDLRTVAAATDNFSSENKLGEGGFGLVYKGQLPDGQDIAVKRLSKTSGQGISEFKNEVLLIAKLQHRNLVRLLGYCIEKGEKMLIYEFVPNKSLDYFIFDQSKRRLLDWKMRFDIILGITRGILYLHQDSRLRIIHRDLKASNILLDGEMKPKISDFGTARIFGGDETQANTKRVVGTYCYMSPEYALEGLFSTKSYIFSFGVILLEIISGKKNRGLFLDDPSSYLIQYTWELWRDGKAMEIVDSCIADSFPTNEVLRCIQVGLLCVQDNAKDRPSLLTVVSMLINETKLPSPKKSTFVIRKNEPDSSSSETNKCSINEAVPFITGKDLQDL